MILLLTVTLLSTLVTLPVACSPIQGFTHRLFPRAPTGTIGTYILASDQPQTSVSIATLILSSTPLVDPSPDLSSISLPSTTTETSPEPSDASSDQPQTSTLIAKSTSSSTPSVDPSHDSSSISSPSTTVESTPEPSDTSSDESPADLENGPTDSGESPIYNLNNISCASTTSMKGTQLWAAVDGDRVVKALNQIFASNQLVCDECFGQDKDSCKSHDLACADGLADLARDENHVSRWDRAAVHFARNPDISDITCSFESDTCSAPPNCEACDGTGAWAVLKSIVTLHNEMQLVWKAIGEARNNLLPQMDIFSATFAPVPSVKDKTTFLSILTAVGGGLLGFIPGAGGIAARTVAKVGSAVVSQESTSSQPMPADTASYLGTFTNITQDIYQEIAEALFRDGQYEWKSADGSNTTVYDMATMMANGSLMEQNGDPKKFIGALVPMYERILLQQLVTFTWTNLEVDGHAHVAFIDL